MRECKFSFSGFSYDKLLPARAERSVLGFRAGSGNKAMSIPGSVGSPPGDGSYCAGNSSSSRCTPV